MRNSRLPPRSISLRLEAFQSMQFGQKILNALWLPVLPGTARAIMRP